LRNLKASIRAAPQEGLVAEAIYHEGQLQPADPKSRRRQSCANFSQLTRSWRALHAAAQRWWWATSIYSTLIRAATLKLSVCGALTVYLLTRLIRSNRFPIAPSPMKRYAVLASDLVEMVRSTPVIFCQPAENGGVYRLGLRFICMSCQPFVWEISIVTELLHVGDNTVVRLGRSVISSSCAIGSAVLFLSLYRRGSTRTAFVYHVIAALSSFCIFT
jgi:hypothetical protein